MYAMDTYETIDYLCDQAGYNLVSIKGDKNLLIKELDIPLPESGDVYGKTQARVFGVYVTIKSNY